MRYLMLIILSFMATPAWSAGSSQLFSSGSIDLDATRVGGATNYGWGGYWHIGGDYNKLAIRSRGEGGQKLEAGEVQLLYSRYLAHFWDVQFGARYDYRPSPRWRGLIAIEGLAPYGVESSFSFYIGGDEQLAGEVELAWPLQLTQKLVAEPYLNGEWAAHRNIQEQRGVGLGVVDTGLILRYEFNRHVALYVDIYSDTHIGTTRRLLEQAGEKVTQRGVKMGLRLFNW